MKIKYKTYRPMSMAKVGDYVVPLIESKEASNPTGHGRTVGKAYKVIETSSSWVRMGLENGVKDGIRIWVLT